MAKIARFTLTVYLETRVDDDVRTEDIEASDKRDAEKDVIRRLKSRDVSVDAECMSVEVFEVATK